MSADQHYGGQPIAGLFRSGDLLKEIKLAGDEQMIDEIHQLP